MHQKPQQLLRLTRAEQDVEALPQDVVDITPLEFQVSTEFWIFCNLATK
jgi:hypothetical protein